MNKKVYTCRRRQSNKYNVQLNVILSMYHISGTRWKLPIKLGTSFENILNRYALNKYGIHFHVYLTLILFWTQGILPVTRFPNIQQIKL